MMRALRCRFRGSVVRIGFAMGIALVANATTEVAHAQQPTATAGAAKPAGSNCIIDFEGSQGANVTRMTASKLPSGAYNSFVGGHVVAHCRGQDITLKADSAEHYGETNIVYLFGHVNYKEPRVTMDADRAVYYGSEGHLHAEGNVYAVTDSGNTMRGPAAEYYRAYPGIRTEPMMTADGRPTLGLVQRDSASGTITDTVHVVADRIKSVNNRQVYAGGTVQITRPDIVAYGDSAFMDDSTGRAQLLVNPKVESKQKDRPFTLTGGLIDVFSTNREVDRIVSSPNGHVVSNDIDLTADSVDMRVKNKQLERAMAWGKSRARAKSPDRDIIADSIDAVLPNQQVREIRAVRKAYATAIPDTATIITKDRDWMEGDTIVAVFDSVPPQANASVAVAGSLDSARVDTTIRDTTQKSPPLKSLVAIANKAPDARAYYHMANQDKIKDQPGVNYVRGRVIDLQFENRELQKVTVLDQASGVYLEAITDSTRQIERPAARPTRVPSGGARPRGGVPPIRRPGVSE